MDQQLQSIFESMIARDLGRVEFHQVVREAFKSLEPVIKKNPSYLESKTLERICESERQTISRVSWVDDRGTVQANRGSRIELNSTLGPYRGGLRFHPSVYLGIIKFLGLEQIFKSPLTGLSIGDGKGGSDFNPHGRSDAEVMCFRQSFMTELYHHLGEYIDMPAGDIGAGGREINHVFSRYKRITSRYGSGMLTDKGLGWGGPLVYTGVTGYDVVALTQEMLKTRGDAFDGKRIMVSSSGNVTIYAIEKVRRLGGRVVVCPDSPGYVMDKVGIDVGPLKQVKKVEHDRIADYVSRRDNAELDRIDPIWDVAMGVALPCVTQNELNGEHATTLVHSGIKAVVGGVNMPTIPEGIHTFQGAGVPFAPGKATDTGGVATSGLEMQQNAMCGSWTSEYTKERLTGIMRNVHDMCAATAEEYGAPGDYVVSANIAGSIKVANAMQAFGLA